MTGVLRFQVNNIENDNSEHFKESWVNIAERILENLQKFGNYSIVLMDNPESKIGTPYIYIKDPVIIDNRLVGYYYAGIKMFHQITKLPTDNMIEMICDILLEKVKIVRLEGESSVRDKS